MKKAFIFLLLVGALEGATFPNGAKYCKVVTTTVMGGATDLTNYTLTVNVTDTEFKDTGNGGLVNSATGADIAFYSGCTGFSTRLKWEIESYDNTTGTIIAHVLRPTLSHTVSDTIGIFYGGTQTVDQSTKAAWTASATLGAYFGVWHLNQATASDFTDATWHGNTLTQHASPTSVAARVGNGLSFNGTTQYGNNLVFTNTPAGNQFLQVSAWVKFNNSASATEVVLSYGHDGGNGGYIFRSAAGKAVTPFGTCSPTGTTTLASGTWYFIGGVYDGSTAKVYVNGVLETSIACSSQNFTSNRLAIGAYLCTCSPDAYAGFLNGTVDEVRMDTNKTAPVDWFLTMYNNQRAAGGYQSVGAQVTPTGGGPTISAISVSSTTPDSLKVDWTTNTTSNSWLMCGTANGGPYTIFSGQQDIVKSGNNYYGVTTHSMAVVLPSQSTLYYCVPNSMDTSGNITQGTQTSGTTDAALATSPIIISSYSRPIFYNDQSSGINGSPNTGRGWNGDTLLGTWADDGAEYIVTNDGSQKWLSGSSAYCCTSTARNATGAFKIDNGFMNTYVVLGNTTGANSTGTTVSNINLPATYTADSRRTFAESMVSVDGCIYLTMVRASSNIGPTIIEKTCDHFTNTISPQSNTGPSATGSSFSAGVYDYPTTIAGTTTPNQVSVPFVGIPYGLQPHFARFGQDWTGTDQAGTDSYVYYMNQTAPHVGRIRKRNIAITDNVDLYEDFVGSAGTDLPSEGAWRPHDNVSGTLVFPSKFGWKPQLHYLPSPFNRWISIGWTYMGQAASDVNQGASIVMWDLGKYPTNFDAATLIGSIPKDTQVYPKYWPVFPNLLLSTYTTLSNGCASVVLGTTGSYIGPSAPPAAGDLYSPTYRYLTLCPGTAPTEPKQYLGNGRGQHLTSGLDVLWAMDVPSYSLTIPNRATPVSTYNISIPATTIYRNGQVVMDPHGLLTGVPQAVSYGSQSTNTLLTSYNAALTGDFTAFVTFKHDNQGSTPSSETVLDKAGLFTVLRNTTTANSWKVKVGSTTSSAFTLTTDGAFATVIVQRCSGTVNVYSNTAIANSPTLTATTSFSDSTSVTGAVTLASLAAGTQPFYGTIGQVAFAPSCLSSVNIIKEMTAIRSDFANKTPAITIP